MSSAGTALLRALLSRESDHRHRILLSNWCSVDWQSLTFSGERHQAGFVIRGPEALELARRWTTSLGDAEFDIGRGKFVADIALCGELLPT
jgi:hypothetical protein